MKVISLTEETRLTGCHAATIGFFDGVHLGHRYVVEQLRRQADGRGWPSMVITFDRHPRQVVDTSWHPLLLTTLDEKVRLLQQTGVDILVVLPFDERMALLSAHDFMLRVLKEQLGVRLLLTGYDNRFGHRTANSSEGFDDYVRYGREMGLDVVCGEGLQTSDFRPQTSDLKPETSDLKPETSNLKPETSDLEPETSNLKPQTSNLKPETSNLKPQTSNLKPFISSSLVRRLLGEGRVEEAAQCLGRPYSLSGTVVHGYQQGRTMGFPTANIKTDACRLVPADGVYAVNVYLKPETSDLKPETSNLKPQTGITNIGMRPTFDGHQRTIETHILDYHGDLYGQVIEIAFVARLRDEQHFGSTEELAQQMARDAETAKLVLGPMSPISPIGPIGPTNYNEFHE